MNWELLNAQKRIKQLRDQNEIHSLPLIPGPDSAWLETVDQPLPSSVVAVHATEPPQPSLSIFKESMAHHGEIGIAAMRALQSSHYQLWLLLHLMDRAGRGWLDLDTVTLHLTDPFSKHKMWQRPRLQQLLKEGNGRFWQLTETRVYYRTHSRVAAVLGIEKLNGRFVTITADQAKTSAATFRAHCFAAWLANHTNPISQQAIEQLTGIPPRSQRRYCQLADIERTLNICIGPKHTQERMQECSWQYSGTFSFTDHLGVQGSQQAQYVAWHLPTGYSVGVDLGTRSRQRRVNKQIDNLANTGVQGNGNMFACERRSERSRLFYENGSSAAKAFNRDGSEDVYWKRAKARTGTGLWHVLQ